MFYTFISVEHRLPTALKTLLKTGILLFGDGGCSARVVLGDLGVNLPFLGLEIGVGMALQGRE